MNAAIGRLLEPVAGRFVKPIDMARFCVLSAAEIFNRRPQTSGYWTPMRIARLFEHSGVDGCANARATANALKVWRSRNLQSILSEVEDPPPATEKERAADIESAVAIGERRRAGLAKSSTGEK